MKLNKGKQPARAHNRLAILENRHAVPHAEEEVDFACWRWQRGGGGNLFARRLQGRDTSKPGAGLRVFMRLRLDAKVWCASWGARRYCCGENSAARYLGDDGFGARCLSHQLQCLGLILWSLVQPVLDVHRPDWAPA